MAFSDSTIKAGPEALGKISLSAEEILYAGSAKISDGMHHHCHRPCLSSHHHVQQATFSQT